jgi:CubicO group peptidase (beta-lactamase class C family)
MPSIVLSAVAAASLLRGWPLGSAVAVVRLDGDTTNELEACGDLDATFAWASVTKLAVAYGAALAVSSHSASYADPAGPPGATLAHLLSHASGLGLESGDPSMPVGARRIYSNAGIDLAAAALAGPSATAQWLSASVAEKLGLSASFAGRAASGAHGPLRDVVALAAALATSRAIDDATRAEALSPFMAELDGVVPGFGRYRPCWWGLGVELHGSKDHWMGTVASPRAFGHFGQSGALVLVDPDEGLLVAATASEPFGEWARATWPGWMDDVLRWGAAR